MINSRRLIASPEACAANYRCRSRGPEAHRLRQLIVRDRIDRHSAALEAVRDFLRRCCGMSEAGTKFVQSVKSGHHADLPPCPLLMLWTAPTLRHRSAIDWLR